MKSLFCGGEIIYEILWSQGRATPGPYCESPQTASSSGLHLAPLLVRGIGKDGHAVG